ncbi:MAG: ABC transporter ATP-binding protein, partial [Firmicutes bacterium]|nr:ABC transporter ATP-binding protein [Bacillota bacterium]
IARALPGRPRLLMLDEPSIGLAPRVAEQIFDAFRQIQAQGTGLLVVEQNAHLALRVADYGYVLETGRVVLEGTAEALATNPNVQALYLGGMEEPSVKGYRRYRPRRRWA